MTMTICSTSNIPLETATASLPVEGESCAAHVGKASEFIKLRLQQTATIDKAYTLWQEILVKSDRTPSEEGFCVEMKGYERKYQLRRGQVTTSGCCAVATSMRALESNMSPLPWFDYVSKKKNLKPGKSWAEKCFEKQIKHMKTSNAPSTPPSGPSSMGSAVKTISKTPIARAPTKPKKMTLTPSSRSHHILEDALICGADAPRGVRPSQMPPKKRSGALLAIHNTSVP